jgi:hypothetical protein
MTRNLILLLLALVAISQQLQAYDIAASKVYSVLAITSYCDKPCIEAWQCEISDNYLKG